MTFVLRAFAVLGLTCAGLLPAASPAAAEPTDPGTWPVAEGNFTTPDDPGWIFFRPSGFGPGGCGIGPDGTIGCDIVPGRWADGTPIQAGQPGPPGSYSCGGLRCPLPPPGTNQTIASAQEPAHYVYSNPSNFTREVDVLPAGQRLVNGNAWCYVGYQGTVSCSSGENGFTLSATYGILQ